MIKFFRNIRQSLLMENTSDQSSRAGKSSLPERQSRAGKYLIYAFGEIILVVIGILMALQINNWNEQRTLQGKVTSIYSIVKSDLKSDIVIIDEVLAVMLPKDSVLRRIMEGELTLEDYQNCERCDFVLIGFPDITLKSRGLTLLEDNSTIFDSQHDSLFIRINEFYSFFNTEIGVDNDAISMDHDDNRLTKLRQNPPDTLP